MAARPPVSLPMAKMRLSFHPVILFCLLIAIQGLFTPNYVITLASAATLFLIFIFFWKKNEPNPIFFGIALQWLVASIELIYCNLQGISLKEKYMYEGNSYASLELLDAAVWLNLYGILFFAIGVWLPIKNNHLKYKGSISWINMYNTQKLLVFYIIYSLVASVMGYYAWLYPGLSQIVLQLINLKFSFLFLLIFISISKNQSILLVTIIVLLELVAGLFSFFASSFLNIIAVLGMAVISSRHKFSFRTQALSLIVFLFVIFFSLTWTAIKKDYRSFLNKGQVTQAVLVSRGEALGKLVQLVKEIDKEDIKMASVSLVNRVGYIVFFSRVIDYVPRVQGHENGRIYAQSVAHFLVPRLLYPDKPSIDDSEHTRKYTGANVNGRETATSISIGYLADAYIDFGSIGMAFPLLLYGLATGSAYRYFYINVSTKAWAWIFTIPFFFLTNINGVNAIKAIGALIIYFVVFFFLRNFLIKIVEKFIGSSYPN